MKITFVGCGKVGAAVAFTACQQGLADQIVMIDATADKARGEALDLMQCRAFLPQTDITAGTFADSAGSDIVVISAGIPRKADEPRVMLLSRNATLIAELVKQAIRYSPNCILFMVTNPLDVMTDLARKVSGLPPERVIGMGTVLDTARYRSYIAAAFDLDARDVDAYVIGEHGETMVPLKQTVTVRGLPLSSFATDVPAKLDAIAAKVIAASGRVIALKGGTVFAPAVSACSVLTAIVRNTQQVLPVATYHAELGVTISLPTLVGREGAYHVLPLALSPAEREMFDRSVATVRSFCEQMDELCKE